MFSAWGPKAGFALFEYELHTRSNADTALGMVTVFCGVFGTLLGGIGVDYFAQKNGKSAFKINPLFLSISPGGEMEEKEEHGIHHRRCLWILRLRIISISARSAPSLRSYSL